MDLYLIRHAIAQERRPGLDDTRRELTDEGKLRFERGVVGLQKLGVLFDRLYHSPWTRAVQTAELLAPILEGAMVPTEYLADDPSQALLDTILGERVGLVGHEPWMSDLLLWLIYGRRDVYAAVAFKKGGVAWLRGEPTPGRMELRALYPPKALRAMG